MVDEGVFGEGLLQSGSGYESGLLALGGVNPPLAALSLQHLGHRWYQPDIGRFIQRDPIGIAGGLSSTFALLEAWMGPL